MSLTPAHDHKERERKIDAVKLCGQNRGPHDFIPMAWSMTATAKHVTHLLCRVCFTRVNVKMLYENFPEAKI